MISPSPLRQSTLERTLHAAATLVRTDFDGRAFATLDRSLQPVLFSGAKDATARESRLMAMLARDADATNALAVWLMSSIVFEQDRPHYGGLVMGMISVPQGEHLTLATVEGYRELGRAVERALPPECARLFFSPTAILAGSEPYLCELLQVVAASRAMTRAEQHGVDGEHYALDPDPHAAEVGSVYVLPGWIESDTHEYQDLAARLERIDVAPQRVRLNEHAGACSGELDRICGASHIFVPYYGDALRAVAHALDTQGDTPPEAMRAELLVHDTADPFLFRVELLLLRRGRIPQRVPLGEVRTVLLLYVALIVLFTRRWTRLDYRFAEGSVA